MDQHSYTFRTFSKQIGRKTDKKSIQNTLTIAGRCSGTLIYVLANKWKGNRHINNPKYFDYSWRVQWINPHKTFVLLTSKKKERQKTLHSKYFDYNRRVQWNLHIIFSNQMEGEQAYQKNTLTIAGRCSGTLIIIS